MKQKKVSFPLTIMKLGLVIIILTLSINYYYEEDFSNNVGASISNLTINNNLMSVRTVKDNILSTQNTVQNVATNLPKSILKNQVIIFMVCQFHKWLRN